jgi:outer membrane protein OmpA-like peptidoglycan-associated protein
MQIKIHYLALAFLVVTTSFLLPSLSFASCADEQTQVNQAVQAQNLDQLESLLAKLENQDNCPETYLDWLKRSMAQIAAAKADSLTQQGKLEDAEKFLQRAPMTLWVTQVVNGDIALRRKEWADAAYFYNQAIDLIADPEATPKAPTTEQIKKVYQLASEAQLLTNQLGNTVSRSGKPSGVMRLNMRGFRPQKRLIPILFKSGKSGLTKQGERAAQQLIAYIKAQGFKKITLIGHTDEKGPMWLNDRISKKRAKALKRYLRRAGIRIRIRTIGKGEREPLQLDNPAAYTQKEIDTLNRRVELKTN